MIQCFELDIERSNGILTLDARKQIDVVPAFLIATGRGEYRLIEQFDRAWGRLEDWPDCVDRSVKRCKRGDGQPARRGNRTKKERRADNDRQRPLAAAYQAGKIEVLDGDIPI